MSYIFLVFASLFFLLLTYSSAASEFTLLDIWTILGCTVIAFSIEIFIAFLFRKWPRLQILVMGSFLLANVIALHLSINQVFLTLPKIYILISGFVGLFITCVIFQIIFENPKIGRYLLMVTFVACAITVTLATIQRSQDTTVASSPENASSISQEFIKFKNKPNVYFIAFDALMPNSLVKQKIQVDAAPYHDILNENFRKINNGFADVFPTVASLNSLLAMSQTHFINIPTISPTGRSGRLGLYPGWTPSPLLQIFNGNGYVTNTIYYSQYFGRAKGPNVDHYWTPSAFTACPFVDLRVLKIVYFGACWLQQQKWVIENLIGQEIIDPIDGLLDSMQKGLASGKPQVWLGYIYSPGHTEHGYSWKNKEDLNNYRDFYMKHSEKTTNYLSKLVSFLRENDPEAILLVFGDHGPLMSRGMPIMENGFPNENNLEYFVKDTYGVYMGIYPKERCNKWLPSTNSRGFTTLIMMAQSIVECLSDQELPGMYTEDAIRPMIYTRPDGMRRSNLNFERFIYE